MQFVLMLKFTAYVEIQRQAEGKWSCSRRKKRGDSVLLNEGSSRNGLPTEGGLN